MIEKILTTGASAVSRRAGLAFVLAVIACAAGPQDQGTSPAGSGCDAACLTAIMEDFLAKTMARRAADIELSSHALLYVNTRPATLEEHPMGRVKTIKSKQIFCDPWSGNVVARAGVEMEDGKIAYISTRLKVFGKKVTQVETSIDDSPRVVASYVAQLDPLMTAPVPVGERGSRAELKGVVERYFQALTDHKPSASDFDGLCDRYHSGQRITNNARNTVEGGRAATCFSSLGGNPPWGPATDVHIPLVDPEHGIVAGYTLLQYQNGTPPMYVSEVFKIIRGKIRVIDNIGLKKQGLREMNFPE